MIPSCDTRPSVGFRPTMFSTADGPVIDPSVSVPIAAAHPFAQVRFAKNNGAGRAQLLNDHRVCRHMVAVDRQRSRRGLHVVVSRDVVLDQNGNPMERTTHLSLAALVVQMLRD